MVAVSECSLQKFNLQYTFLYKYSNLRMNRLICCKIFIALSEGCESCCGLVAPTSSNVLLHRYGCLLFWKILRLDSKSRFRVTFAERFSRLNEKTLSFQILFAEHAIKALTMVVIVECLYPPISSFDRKPARDTFCCKKFIPIFFTIG